MSNMNEKSKGRIDGFFLGCMAGVAAVSVAATLMISGMTGGSSTAPETVYGGANVPTGEDIIAVLEEQAEALKMENSSLKSQIELQKKQIISLQAELIDLTGEATMPELDGGDEVLSEQRTAYDILNQIKAAYTDFDRDTLEELIPEMDKRLTYLSEDALQEYYTILEYVEMPSNG